MVLHPFEYNTAIGSAKPVGIGQQKIMRVCPEGIGHNIQIIKFRGGFMINGGKHHTHLHGLNA
jgi:hypothetical protein